jgi:hypothetical protein
MHAAPTAVSVCRRCGIVAPSDGTACDVCGTALAALRKQAPALPADHVWVAVRCGFTCNSCRFLAPLDSLDADAAVECAHCGLRQRFDIGNWRPALEFAHSVGDLAGPAAEGRNPHPSVWIGTDNPYADIGAVRTFGHLEINALTIDASPGYPVCERCAEPLHVVLTGPAACECTCPKCGERSTFKLGDGARQLYPCTLASIADDCRTDQPKVQLRATGAGGISINCSSCGAPLDLAGKSTVQTCSYCGTTSLISHRSLNRALHAPVEPSIWWLLFRGISPKRLELLAEHQRATKQTALKLLKLGRPKGIGDAPGVYEAPEVAGWNLPQLAFTVLLGLLALLVAFVITRFIDPGL